MKYFCDKCKAHPAEKGNTLIAAHYCASFSVRSLIPLNMLSWMCPVFDVNAIIGMIYTLNMV